MKRTGNHAGLNLYAALIKDMVAWDPGLRIPLSRDLNRIELMVNTRGVSFLMIDMPEAAKVVDHALSRGKIDPSQLPHTFGMVVGGAGREFLYSLFEKVFSPFSGMMFPDRTDVTAVYFLRQFLLLSKKVRKECSNASILAEVRQFEEVDRRLRAPTLTWELDSINLEQAKRLSFLDGYRSKPDLISSRDDCPAALLRVLDTISNLVVSQIRELDWADIVPRHGPGAVADAVTGTDKYLFPTWPRKLELVFPYSIFTGPAGDLRQEAYLPCSLNEPSARLLAVPKTLKGPRLIASEPIAHQFIQLGLMKWLRQGLPRPLRASIDFLDQTPSRRMCLEASKGDDYATVDLSAASDRLSCWTVERMFRAHQWLLLALHASRTRTLVNATGVGERFHLKLRKFAAMGSGVTFPVQSVCYAIICAAALAYEEKIPVRKGRGLTRLFRRFRVFGDDIILPSHALPALALLLTHLELKVNVLKTHYSGRFRESCGMDAYDGFDVSPLYLRDLELRDSADGLVSWVDVLNNAYSKGLWSLSDTMARMIPDETRKLLPISSVNLGCLTLLSYPAKSPVGKKRISPDLQREEVLGLVPQVSQVRGKRESYHNLLQYFLEAPSQETKWSAGWTVRNRFRLRKRWVSAHSYD